MIKTSNQATAARPKPRAASATLAALGASVALLAPAAHAGVVVGWNFENAALGATVIAASTMAAGVSAASFKTANNGVEDFAGNHVAVTRFFGAVDTPSLAFALADAFSGSLSFTHFHNHNPTQSTFPQYEFDVQLSFNGGAWADIASDLVASAATYGDTVTIAGLDLQAGSYAVRWVGNHFVNGSNSGTEYFALDNVNFASLDQAVPEPASLGLVSVALIGAGLARKRRQ